MRTTPAAVLLGAALLTGACAEVGEVVEQASERAHEVAETARYCVQAIEVAHAVSDQDVDAAVEAGRELVEVAPSELADDAQLLLEAAEQAQGGDTAALADPDVAAAAQRVRTETDRTCSPGE